MAEKNKKIVRISDDGLQQMNTQKSMFFWYAMEMGIKRDNEHSIKENKNIKQWINLTGNLQDLQT